MASTKTLLSSSNLKAIDFDPQNRTATITFHSGHSYKYFNVSHSDVSALKNADSHGQHFAKHWSTKRFRRL